MQEIDYKAKYERLIGNIENIIEWMQSNEKHRGYYGCEEGVEQFEWETEKILENLQQVILGKSQQLIINDPNSQNNASEV